ncbi:MAG: oxidoreductase, aldo/keto reductase family protein [Oscillospiraceae bacterium]|jgi:hypothetical protein|nr:oxidoreductase, aldo/keto reductase family protein [Oscillospiraceae bacterium]
MKREDLLKIPKLGFGFMRLPMKNGQIDMEMTCKMVDKFMENGFTYFDTAYVYHGGKSEVALKEALVMRHPRESFTIADKLPAWELKCKEDVDKIFNEELERTGAGYFDFYLLHSIETGHLAIYDKYDCWAWGQEMKKKGLIKNFGFSFHDKPDLLDKILTDHPEVDFVQLQINYIDWDNEIVCSGGCYEVARRHGVPIMIMEPVKGGNLARLRPDLEEKMKAVSPERSIASWAMRFCGLLDGVAVVLSGMSDMEQLDDNIKTFKTLEPFSQKEKLCLEDVVNDLLSAPTIPCTGCAYCVDGCPAGIKIPDIISAYNTVLTYGDHDRPHFFYGGITKGGHTANSCLACGQCETVCPQHIEIIDVLQRASKIFDK